jgi:hypothetical protein
LDFIYDSTKRLKHFGNETTLIAKGLYTLIKENHPQVIEKQLCVPIRAGIHDIVFAKNKFNDFKRHSNVTMPNDGFGYEDFSLSRILDYTKVLNPNHHATQKIGIWNWYIPSIPILVLHHQFSAIKQSLGNTPIDQFFQNYHLSKEERSKTKIYYLQMETWINETIDFIKENIRYFEFINDPIEAQEKMANGDIWCLLGGGSFLINPKIRREKVLEVEIIIPKEGTLIFVECIAIIAGNDSEDKEELEKLVRSFLDIEWQKGLILRNSYHSCPTTHKALEFVHQNKDDHLGGPLFHGSNCNNLFRESGKNFELTEKRFLRKVPKSTCDWENQWNSLVNANFHDQS